MKIDGKGLYKLQRSPVCVDQYKKKYFFNWPYDSIKINYWNILQTRALQLKYDPFLWQLNLINWQDNDIVRCDVAQYSIVLYSCKMGCRYHLNSGRVMLGPGRRGDLPVMFTMVSRLSYWGEEYLPTWRPHCSLPAQCPAATQIK